MFAKLFFSMLGQGEHSSVWESEGDRGHPERNRILIKTFSNS